MGRQNIGRYFSREPVFRLIILAQKQRLHFKSRGQSFLDHANTFNQEGVLRITSLFILQRFPGKYLGVFEGRKKFHRQALSEEVGGRRQEAGDKCLLLRKRITENLRLKT